MGSQNIFGSLGWVGVAGREKPFILFGSLGEMIGAESSDAFEKIGSPRVLYVRNPSGRKYFLKC